MKEYIKYFKALTDDTRIRIIRILAEADSELCVCEIVDTLQLPGYTVSRHMKELRNAELVDERKEGRFIFYSLAKDRTVFEKGLFELIRTIPEEVFAEDIKMLRNRISQREAGLKE